MLLLTASFAFAGLLIPWGIGLDFANFYDAGHKALAGQFADLYDPFAQIDGKKPLGNMSFFSAPLTSYLYTPMAALPPRIALVLFKISGTLALVVALFLLYRHLLPLSGGSRRDHAVFFALFSTSVFLFQPFWTIYRIGGQTTPWVFLIFVLALISYSRDEFTKTALLYGLAVLIKPAFAPGAILMFVISGARFRISALLFGAAVAAVSVLLLGWQIHIEFVKKILSEAKIFSDPSNNSSPFSFLEPWFIDEVGKRLPTNLSDAARTTGNILRLATALALLAGLWAALRLRLPVAARRHAAFHASLLVSLILSPVVWSHYLAMLFPLLAIFIAHHHLLPKGAKFVLALAVFLSFLQNRLISRKIDAWVDFDNFINLTLASLFMSLPILLVLMTMLIWHRAIGQQLISPLWSSIGSKT
jgi:hypothetical protein